MSRQFDSLGRERNPCGLKNGHTCVIKIYCEKKRGFKGRATELKERMM